MASEEIIIGDPLEDECAPPQAQAGTTVDVLDARIVHPMVYPVIETWVTGRANGYLGDPQPTPQARVWHRYRSCCFHDLRASNEQELAGMGLCIIGNICKGVSAKQISSQADARLELKLSQAHGVIALPWPGMPDDRPVPLDLVALPFQFEMFLHDESKQFQRRVDRLALMRRIEEVWVAHLLGLLKVQA